MSSESDVCLQTLRVRLRGAGGERIVRALIDTGSHKSYVLGTLAQELQSEALGHQTMVHLLFGGTKSAPRNHRMYKVYLRSLDGSYECCTNMFNEDIICKKLPTVYLGSWQRVLRESNVSLSDTCGSNKDISILIGADTAGRLYTGKLVQLDNGPTALETKLGWTIMGRTDSKVEQRNDAALTVLSMFNREAKISDLWELDVLGITDPTVTSSKEAILAGVKQQFVNTIKLNEDGKYEVHLPWKDDHAPLGDNSRAALKRLHVLRKKLNSQNLYTAYEKVFDDWLGEGIIELVESTEEISKGYFLPHRHVIKINSSTPIRPVFDASADSDDGPSLNECLHTGPNLIELIINIILKFRINKIGITADISKAFLQIGIVPADREALKFLWWSKSYLKRTIVYRHRRVLFGINSSPFLLGATIEYHLQRALEYANSPKDVEHIDKLRKSFYVDNCITSVESEEERASFQTKSVKIMQQGGFDLRGWESSHTRNDRETSPILGVLWNKENDSLFINVNVAGVLKGPVTKRKILSVAHKIFDPLGWVCPALLHPKLMLQELWGKDVGWDKEVPVVITAEFEKWLEQVHLIQEIEVPRWIFGERNNKITFHVFVDASKLAYAAAIFVRVEKSHAVETHLVQAKSRVGPNKPITIP